MVALPPNLGSYDFKNNKTKNPDLRKTSLLLTRVLSLFNKKVFFVLKFFYDFKNNTTRIQILGTGCYYDLKALTIGIGLL